VGFGGGGSYRHSAFKNDGTNNTRLHNIAFNIAERNVPIYRNYLRGCIS